MVWKAGAPQGHEVSKVIWDTVPYTRGVGLDIGCGPLKVWPHAIGVDNQKETALFGIPMEPDVKCLDASKLTLFTGQSMDWVFSSHLLEHIEDHVAALKEWWRVLKPGGYLMLYLPHKDYYPNCYGKDEWDAWIKGKEDDYNDMVQATIAYAAHRKTLGFVTTGDCYAGSAGVNEDHKHDFIPQDVVDAMLEVGGWDLLECEERNKGSEYSFYLVFKKLGDKAIHRYSHAAPKPEKTCGIVRYGAWGDVIQMSSILPGLKAQGYHVTLYTETRSMQAIQHEHLIDRFIVQDRDQVPNGWLGQFFDHTAKKYDKWLNLCETVEGTFLALPDRIHAKWSQAARHTLMNHNYIEVLHQLSDIPFGKPAMRFVPSEDEKAWVKHEKAKLDASPLIMWILAGSSIHKVWPHMDPILARIMLAYPKAKVITCGDARCKKMIEEPWEKEPRIIKRSAVWTIRETMAMSQACDLVIGPETGVMSAMSMEPMPKILMLSHSSVENLTKGWINTYSLHSTETPCYPCHKMIYKWEECNRDEPTGTAHCMAHITPDTCWHALISAFDGKDYEINPRLLEPVEEAA